MVEYNIEAGLIGDKIAVITINLKSCQDEIDLISRELLETGNWVKVKILENLENNSK